MTTVCANVSVAFLSRRDLIELKVCRPYCVLHDGMLLCNVHDVQCTAQCTCVVNFPLNSHTGSLISQFIYLPI